ncbi:MAG: hypothetical protein FWB72_02670 [Firmicutes bacterium]|nr:hypothetical protein [Bacillota bacterium]
MSIFFLTNETHEALKKDKNFTWKLRRPYFLVEGLVFKNKKISVAIPKRSNVSNKFANEVIRTPNTSTTMKGNISGWHISKFVPFDKELFIDGTGQTNPDILRAEQIGIWNTEKIKSEVQRYLNLIEQGNPPKYVIHLGKMLKEYEKLKDTQKEQEVENDTFKALEVHYNEQIADLPCHTERNGLILRKRFDLEKNNELHKENEPKKQGQVDKKVVKNKKPKNNRGR